MVVQKSNFSYKQKTPWFTLKRLETVNFILLLSPILTEEDYKVLERSAIG
ncbi:hypothetical protein ES705_32919 [subsurface metagenome]